MTFGFIEAEKASFPITRMCRVLGVSQSGFFAWQERPACRRQQQDMVYLAHIRTAFALSNGTYGSPRMHRDLVDAGHQIGRHRTARLMRENQLIARQKRRFKRTTYSEHTWPVAPNLVAQDFTADGPNRKWGADISYIWTAEGWLYGHHPHPPQRPRLEGGRPRRPGPKRDPAGDPALWPGALEAADRVSCSKSS